jgi:PmbA protein
VTPDELLELADRVVDRAEPGEQLEAVVAWSRDTEARAYAGEVEHFVSAESAGLGVRIIRDGRQGLSWVGVLDDDTAIAECVAEARDNASFGTPDEFAGLAAPDGVPVQELALFDERLAGVPTERKIELAIQLERDLLAADPRMLGVESADYADSESASAIASTTGIRVAGAETSAYVGTWALAGDGDDVTTGFGFSVGRGVDDLDVDRAVADAVERCVGMLGATKAPSSRLTVVFDPYVCSQFLGVVAEMLSGEAVLRGRSPFAGRVGEAVAAPALTLVDDPLDVLAPTAADIDGEGLACRRVELIGGGALHGYLHNAYTGRSMGTVSTGSASRGSHRSAPSVGPRSIRPAPGSGGLADVVAGVGDGLLVRELSGLHSGVNPTSGDLSVGVEGRMIRGGELAEAVREVTIASTLPRMLLDIVALGDDLTLFPWESAGVTLAVADVMMSGT